MKQRKFVCAGEHTSPRGVSKFSTCQVELCFNSSPPSFSYILPASQLLKCSQWGSLCCAKLNNIFRPHSLADWLYKKFFPIIWRKSFHFVQCCQQKADRVIVRLSPNVLLFMLLAGGGGGGWGTQSGIRNNQENKYATHPTHGLHFATQSMWLVIIKYLEREKWVD